MACVNRSEFSVYTSQFVSRLCSLTETQKPKTDTEPGKVQLGRRTRTEVQDRYSQRKLENGFVGC